MTRNHKRLPFAYLALVTVIIGSGQVLHGHLWWGILFLITIRCTIGVIKGQ